MPARTTFGTGPTFGTGLAERLIRHAHIATTNQALAFDAIQRLNVPSAEAWRRLFLQHADLFAVGAAAPDRDFRDFKNHILLPRDGYWGGAPVKAQSWYQNLIAALKNAEWQNVAFCAGVLSHYITDPLHPFHTGQSDAENEVHFALDVTVRTTYLALSRMGVGEAVSAAKLVPAGPNFLAAAIVAGAEAANADYETLLAHFSLRRADGDPATGLDSVGQRVMAKCLARAVVVLAAVLDRAILEAGTNAPQSSVTAAGLKSFFRWPIASVGANRAMHRYRTTISAMRRELDATGRVVQNLSEAEQVKRDLYAKEVLPKRQRVVVDNVFPFEQKRRSHAEVIETTAAQAAAKAVAAAQAVAAAKAITASQAAAIAANAGTTDAEAANAAAASAAAAAAAAIPPVTAEIIPIRRARVAMEPPRPAPRHVEADPIRRRADVLRQLKDEQPEGNDRSATVPVAPPARPSVQPSAPAVFPAAAAAIDQAAAAASSPAAAAASSPAAAAASLVQPAPAAAHKSAPHAKAPAHAKAPDHVNVTSRSTTKPSHHATTAHTADHGTARATSGSAQSPAQTLAQALSQVPTQSVAPMTDPVAAPVASPAVAQSPPSLAEAIPSVRPSAERSQVSGAVAALGHAAAAALVPAQAVSASFRDRRSAASDIVRPMPLVEPRLATADSLPRWYLTLDQDVADAPSVGRENAEALHAAGVDSVDEFLKTHAIALAARLEREDMSPEVIEAWQDQARLVLDVPNLTGLHAQLLAGAGYRTAAALAAAETEKLCADVLAYALTPTGRGLLRDGAPPDLAHVRGWVDAARSVKAA